LRFGGVDVLELDDDVDRRTSGRPQPVEDSRLKGRVSPKYSFETSTRFTRGRHD
jgi:hypothetical protein